MHQEEFKANTTRHLYGASNDKTYSPQDYHFPSSWYISVSRHSGQGPVLLEHVLAI